MALKVIIKITWHYRDDFGLLFTFAFFSSSNQKHNDNANANDTHYKRQHEGCGGYYRCMYQLNCFISYLLIKYLGVQVLCCANSHLWMVNKPQFSYTFFTPLTKDRDEAFNSITGLNGSGKSNILDAICFVLGITSLTTVRAQNLQVFQDRAHSPATRADMLV